MELRGKIMKNFVLALLTTCFLLPLSCDNPSSSKENETIGKIEFTVIDSTFGPFTEYREENIMIRKEFNIEKTNVMDLQRILSIPIIVDTTIYEPYVSLCYVDSGGVLIIQNDYIIWDDGWYNPLAKSAYQSENEILVSQVYFFTTLKGLHPRSSMSFKIWFTRKNGSSERKEYTIQNPDQYCILEEDASMIISLEDICENVENIENIETIDMMAKLESKDIFEDYLVVQISKLYDDDISVIWRAFKTNASINREYAKSQVYHI